MFTRRRISTIVAGVSWGLALAFCFFTTVFAHESLTVGDYAVEYGWISEPAVAGQPNAVVINLSPTDATKDPNVDVSALKVEAVFGGQTKVLALQPLGEDTPGQFIAPITPMRPGRYTIHLSGTVGATNFNTDVLPEEVQTADVVQFPVETASAQGSGGSALSVAGVVLGALGTILGALALVRKSQKG